jgi:hypothetical protein
VRYTLDEHVRHDPRILTVYSAASRLHDRRDRYHHNFDHVLRDLYRALVIASEEGPVVFYCMTWGFQIRSSSDWDTIRSGRDLHRVYSSMRAMMRRPSRPSATASGPIKGRPDPPQTLEAKILYDADVLEKAGLVYLILAGKIVCEFSETISDFLERESSDRTNEVERGFYTRRARIKY